MDRKYVWRQSDWPGLRWRGDDLLGLLGQARKAQGQIIAQADFIGLEAQATILVEEAFTTSAIEGEKLDRNSIRSSVARRLGLPTAGLSPTQRNIDGLVEVLMDATNRHSELLTAERLFGWHNSLFPAGYSGLRKIKVASWRKSTEPMQVVSGPIGREKVHFEAVPAKAVSSEMKRLLKWWNRPPEGLDGLIRAGLVHFWFVTIHPFEDGNGRLARALTDMALAQDEKTGRRLYSISSQINQERNDYYAILERSQKSTCDVTEWLRWFLGIFTRSIEGSQGVITKALTITKFWQTHSQSALNERQRKAINRLLEAGPEGFVGGLTNRKYVSLNRVSRETAKRDLADLENRGILKRNEGGGRSISFALNY